MTGREDLAYEYAIVGYFYNADLPAIGADG